MTKVKLTDQHKQDFVYAGKTQTAIWHEQAGKSNPYISQNSYLYGYPHTELLAKKSYPEVLFLLLTGELPSTAQTILLERLMIALINLGPRHPAVKASMVAGVSKTNTEHLLPIGLSVLGGEENGAKEVAEAITFLQDNQQNDPVSLAQILIEQQAPNIAQGETRLIAGFGCVAGDIDEHVNQLAAGVLKDLNLDNYPTLAWAQVFVNELNRHKLGWLVTGLAAAVLTELKIPAREAIGIFQLLCAPGIFAHGVEQTHKPITAMPMLSDEQHIYNPD